MKHGLAASRPVSAEADNSRGDERRSFWWQWKSVAGVQGVSE